jgi:large subunit ribosomal protein L11
MEQGMPIPVVITAYADKTFTYITKTPPVSYFIKKAANIQSGSGKTGITASIAKITTAQVRDIAEQKIQDMNAGSIEAACQMIIGSARSMGVDVVEG